MLTHGTADRRWSDFARIALIWCVVGSIVLSFADGVIYAQYMTATHSTAILMLKTWVTDFRLLAEQGVYAATVLFVGAKFFETRTVLTIAFDKLDSAKLSFRGPDDDNIIWIGRRYGTRMEAEAVVAAMQSRLQSSSGA